MLLWARLLHQIKSLFCSMGIIKNRRDFLHSFPSVPRGFKVSWNNTRFRFGHTLWISIINDLDGGGIESAPVMKRSRLRKQQGLLALTRSAWDYCPMACTALLLWKCQTSDGRLFISLSIFLTFHFTFHLDGLSWMCRHSGGYIKQRRKCHDRREADRALSVVRVANQIFR